MNKKAQFLLFLSAVTAAVAEGPFLLSIVRYEDYNRMNTECIYNGSESFGGSLQYKVNSRTPISFSRPETRNSGCATVTLESDLHNASKNWNISVVLQGCDQVQVRCGNKRADSSYELSSPLTLRVQSDKAAGPVVVCPLTLLICLITGLSLCLMAINDQIPG